MGANGGPSWDWRAELAGDDPKAVEAVARYKDPKEFTKAFLEQRATLSKKQEPLKLTETSTADDVAAYRKALDVPEVPKEAKDEAYADAYGLNLPEEAGIPAPLIGAFAKKMNSKHIPKSHVQAAVGEFTTIQAAIAARTQTLNEEKRQEWESAQRKDLGSREYEGRLAAAQAFLDKRFENKMDDLAAILNAPLQGGGILKHHPEFRAMMAELAMQNGFTDRIEQNAYESGGKSLAQQQQELEGLRRTNSVAYNDPQNQQKLKRIIELRQKSGEIDSWGNEIRRRA